MNDADKILKKCEKIKKNNDKKSQTEKNILEKIYKEIKKNHMKNNQINSINIKKLNSNSITNQIPFQKNCNKQNHLTRP